MKLLNKLFKPNKIHRINNGILGEKISERDYEFAGAIDENNLPKSKNSFKKVWYNQNDVSSMSCTLHAALGAFSDLTGYEFSLQERKDLWNQALLLGASDSFGWYVLDAVDLVRKYVNTLGIGKFATVRMITAGEVFKLALKQGYSIVTGYNGNESYNKDIQDDGIIQSSLIGAKTYSHAIRLVDTDTSSPYEVEVRDNYLGASWWDNDYIVKDIITMYSSGTWFSSGYIFVYDEPVIEKIIDKKLTTRFENRMIYNKELNQFAVIKGGKKVMFSKMYDLLTAAKWADTKDSYATGVTLDNWNKIGS